MGKKLICIAESIFKDVNNENESKKAAVMIRLVSLVMCVYFLLLTLMFVYTKEYHQALTGLGCIAVYLLVFYMTYHSRTGAALKFSGIFTLLWIVLFVINSGWDTGVQHFLFVLVVLYYLASYDKKSYKIIFTVVLCVLRLVLYWYCRENEPKYLMPDELVVVFQCLNTVAIFIEISIITMISSAGSHDMEKKLVTYNKKLERLSSIDELTGLYNRRAITKYLDEITAQKNTEPFAIAIGDIDFFKKINDNYGHDCGDVVLEKLSELMEQFMRGKGVVARWGGEEFLLVFEGINGDFAYEVLFDLLKQIRRMQIPYGEECISLTMTFGLTEYSNFEGINAIIREADEKLYRGKATGRNQVVY